MALFQAFVGGRVHLLEAGGIAACGLIRPRGALEFVGDGFDLIALRPKSCGLCSVAVAARSVQRAADLPRHEKLAGYVR
jgi:hypothetical protein